jgi:hypothetical protein
LPHLPAGDDLYQSNSEFGLEPAASEYYGAKTGTNYYSVAVVRASFCKADSKPNLASLQVRAARPAEWLAMQCMEHGPHQPLRARSAA